MTNITFEEWEETIRVYAEACMKRFPGLKVSVDATELHLQSEGCRGMVSLRPTPGANGMAAHAAVSSGPALLGLPSVVESGVADYRRVLDALHYVNARIQEVAVWSKGACPCDTCNDTGNIRGDKCKECHLGKR